MKNVRITVAVIAVLTMGLVNSASARNEVFRKLASERGPTHKAAQDSACEKAADMFRNTDKKMALKGLTAIGNIGNEITYSKEVQERRLPIPTGSNSRHSTPTPTPTPRRRGMPRETTYYIAGNYIAGCAVYREYERNPYM